MSKKKLKRKSRIVWLALIFVALAMLVGVLFFLRDEKEPGLLTISQGTQMTYEDISIGLVSVDDKSARISVVDKDNPEEQLNDEVSVGSRLSLSGYNIEIKSINKSWHLISKPGSGEGSVGVTINKD